MSLVAVLFALLLEQARPLGRGNVVHALSRAWVRWCARSFDAGDPFHGWLTWGFAVGLPALLTLAVYWGLQWWLGWPFALAWSAAVLYATLGFRQFSFHFTQIRDALAEGDEDRARELLAQWQQVDVGTLPPSAMLARVVEQSVLASHRHVFGVLAWYTVLASIGLGPAGAVLYRLAEFVARYWKHGSTRQMLPASESLQQTGIDAWALIDWLPVRLTALAFAIVGNFEDAVDAWRNFVPRHAWDNDGLVLAATVGALNLPWPAGADAPTRVDGSTASSLSASEPTLQSAHLPLLVGLVWRSVVMWVLLITLLTFAHLMG